MPLTKSHLATPGTRRLRYAFGVRAGGERGAAAVEFALILPVLVLLIFGIIEFGRGYNAKIEITGAAREGARVLAVGSGDPAAAAIGAAPTLDSGKLSVTASASPCVPGSSATVTVAYPFEYNVPLFGAATVTLTSKGVMRCGG